MRADIMQSTDVASRSMSCKYVMCVCWASACQTVTLIACTDHFDLPERVYADVCVRTCVCGPGPLFSV